MKTKTPALKKVKIDDHIKRSKKPSDPTPARKRGRPRKDPKPHGESQQIDRSGDSPLLDDQSNSVPTSPDPAGLSTAPEIIPVYDTTEEARAFLRTPFDLAAGLTNIPELSLYPAQLDAMAPSFKVVYDKHIRPKLGENADVYAFAIVAVGVIAEKVQVFREKKSLHAPDNQPNKTDSSGYPSIPLNNNPSINQ